MISALVALSQRESNESGDYKTLGRRLGFAFIFIKPE
jgi:hypothetical protein